MAHKFCTRCRAEVEDAGGYCLLGHELRDDQPVDQHVDSLSALRAEVNRTFDEARRELVDVMAPAAAIAPVIVTPPVTSAPQAEARPSAFVPPPPSVQLEEDFRVPESPDAAAHPPAHSVWDDLDDAPLAPGDPIASFAPEPRMDWGPQKTRLMRKRTRPAKLQPEG
jgi:hypothetical protein